MRGPAAKFWIVLCVMAQVLWCAVPQGTTVCVRSLLSPVRILEIGSTAKSILADDDSCGECCCSESEELPDACCGELVVSSSGGDRPAPGPCRERDCSLCVKSVAMIAPSRAATDTENQLRLVAWAAIAPPTFASVNVAPRPAWPKPPPTAPPDGRGGLVGIVILQV